MKSRLLTFLFINLTICQAQEGSFSNWKPHKGLSLTLEPYGDDCLLTLSGSAYYLGWAASCKRRGDTLILMNPAQSAGCDISVEYKPSVDDSIWLHIYEASMEGIYTLRSAQATPLLLNGLIYDSLRHDIVDSILIPDRKYDSLKIDDQTILLHDHKKGQDIFIYLSRYGDNDKLTYKNGFPMHYDSIRLIWRGNYWSLIPDSVSAEYDLTWFEELIPKTWEESPKGKIVNEEKDHSRIPAEEVTIIRVRENQSSEIDITAYPNLQQLIIHTNHHQLKVRAVKKLQGLEVHTDTSLNYIDIELPLQQTISSIYTSVPVRKTNLRSALSYKTHVYSDKQKRYLSKPVFKIQRLFINYANHISINSLKKWNSVRYLSIHKDTITINASTIDLPVMDSLILYGHATNFEFINSLPQLKYIGVYYSNKETFHDIIKNYPNLQHQYWCFPLGSKVAISNNKSLPIEKIRVGDSVLCIGSNIQFCKTMVTAIEYHIQAIDTLIAINIQQPLADLNYSQENNSTEAVFTKQHPIYVIGKALTYSSMKSTDRLFSIEGTVSVNYCSINSRPYRGTLINIRTEAGNYFINGIAFMNK